MFRCQILMGPPSNAIALLNKIPQNSWGFPLVPHSINGIFTNVSFRVDVGTSGYSHTERQHNSSHSCSNSSGTTPPPSSVTPSSAGGHNNNNNILGDVLVHTNNDDDDQEDLNDILDAEELRTAPWFQSGMPRWGANYCS